MEDIIMSNDKRLLTIQVRDKLEKRDYELFRDKVESLMQQHDKVRILLELVGFKGWTAGALWEDIKFDVKHFNDIERLAIVGSKKWQKGMAVFCRPFTTATIRYFDTTEYQLAEAWISERK
jgi:hypothetical protein